MSSTHRVSKPFLIGVAGGTASGKSTVCQKIMAKLGEDCQRRVAIIKQDSFYRTLNPTELALAKKGCFNFDHPDAVDEEAMYVALKDILNGKSVKLPIHDYMEHRPRDDEFYEVNQADVVLFEGVLIFYFPKVRDMFHMKLFVDTDSDTRLSRRVMRDVQERGRSLDLVLNQYDQFVKPAFEEFCQPTKKYSDMIIPRGAENEVAIGLINHNVIYLLSNESKTLRGVYSRNIVPLRPSSPCQQPLQSSPPGQLQSQLSDSPVENEDPLCAVLQGHRSRSDSVVASAQNALLVAAQRFRKDPDQEGQDP